MCFSVLEVIPVNSSRGVLFVAGGFRSVTALSLVVLCGRVQGAFNPAMPLVVPLSPNFFSGSATPDLFLSKALRGTLKYAVLTNGNHVEQEKVSLQHDTESQESCF
ncbi:hypothetical protein AALO_G00190760 [Alosa alosa]|uniref:Uncharacterized protein n=1 Tax=Alosa alosa TaxID=278164 RepID=A0AAV6G5P6_9TELE|nr:hypothetical protein AALO_G00190760 [Alosa alosa]